MLNLRSVLLALAATTVMGATSAASALAYQPSPTNHLVADVYPTAMVAGGQNWSDLGDLQATQFMTVTATGITGPTTVTFLGAGPSGVQRQVVLANGVQTRINFGQVVNADGTGELIAVWPATTTQTHVHLDIVASSPIHLDIAAPRPIQLTDRYHPLEIK
jgi:hypothetical protein